MSDLEKFWHNESIFVPDLIKIAISHYQFETIHPFLDGNGRIGRLLITLYLSDFLEQHRGNYYDALTSVRSTSDLAHWVKFFLTAVIETAENGKQTFQAILVLRNELESKMVTLGKRAENARALLVALYGKPVVSVNDVSTLLGLTHKAANGLVGQFVELGMLEEITGFQRNRMYVFRRYLTLFG